VGAMALLGLHVAPPVLAGPEPICDLKKRKGSRISYKREHNANKQTTAGLVWNAGIS